MASKPSNIRSGSSSGDTREGAPRSLTEESLTASNLIQAIRIARADHVCHTGLFPHGPSIPQPFHRHFLARHLFDDGRPVINIWLVSFTMKIKSVRAGQ